jgi:sugar lactone lactonase YvrE
MICYAAVMTAYTALTATPTLLISSQCTIGESPRWHSGERQLYWADITEQRMHRWDPETGVTETRQFDQPLACFAFRQNGGFILGMKDGCALLESWDGAPVAFGRQVLAGKPNYRMNDGRTDAMGRFWLGSFNGARDVPEAELYRLDPDGSMTTIEGGMLTCNGAAFNADGTRFTHADTPSHAVRLYDVDQASGTLSNRRIFHQFPEGVGPGLGRPDGGSFDAEGCYWTALFDGWQVVRLSPTGELLREIPLPVQRPTMIAFGGDDGCTAFVTSARVGLSDDERASQPCAGDVFAFRVDVPGVQEFPFAA